MFPQKPTPCLPAAAGARTGFALVMLAAFVLVLGLVTAVMVTGSKREAYWKPQTGTTKSLETIPDQMIKYQRANYSLPCPAPMNALPGAPEYGDDTNCTTTSAASGTSRVEIQPAGSGRFMRIGALPYKTLGLTEDYALDGHGNRLYYAVMEEVTDRRTFWNATGAITVKDGAGADLATDAAYIVFSTGADGKGATASTGIAAAIACPSDNSAGADFENCDGDTVFVQGNFQTATPGSSYFDDQLLWARADALSQQNAPLPKLYCWGWNENGQLGDGTTTNRTTHVLVQPPASVPARFAFTSVSPGLRHSCGIGNDTKAYCWGGGGFARSLGDGTTAQRSAPVPVLNPTGAPAGFTFTSVLAGHKHSCGMGSDGKVYCWGDNSHGDLGDGTNTHRTIPVPVVNPTGTPVGFAFTSVSLTAVTTCGIGNDSKAYCWGYNIEGAIGDGTMTNRTRPVPISNPAGAPVGFNFTKIDPGFWHTCGIGNDGKAYCWGRNAFGQLGNNSFTRSLIPVPVSNPTGAPVGFVFTSVVASGEHTCGMGNDGKAYCWGGSGVNGTASSSSVPVPISNPAGAPVGFAFTSLEAWWWHACAKGNDGRTYCWGLNNYGQLGDGTTTDRLTPVPVSNPASMPVGFNFASVIGGEKSACALAP
jgi:alpha-tubulin suppressor-like RCC1 family protein